MKKGNLLLIDDEPLILKTLKYNLEDYADDILTAENGIDGIQLLKDNDIHCVICDINMPKMTGVEVVKQIREDGNDVPFIFYTAHGNHELMLEAIKYGAFDFLNKPNLEGLEDVVSRGLKEGFRRVSPEDSKSADTFISEYQELLEQIKS